MINVKFNFLVLTSGERKEIGLGSVQVRGKKSETNTIFDEAQQWVLFKALFK